MIDQKVQHLEAPDKRVHGYTTHLGEVSSTLPVSRSITPVHPGEISFKVA